MLLLVLGIGHVETNLNNIRLGVKMGIIRFLWHDFFVIIYFWICWIYFLFYLLVLVYLGI